MNRDRSEGRHQRILEGWVGWGRWRWIAWKRDSKPPPDLQLAHYPNRKHPISVPLPQRAALGITDAHYARVALLLVISCVVDFILRTAQAHEILGKRPIA